MKKRLLLLTAILSLMAFAFACGGTTTNVNVTKPANAVTNTTPMAAMTPASSMASNTTTSNPGNMAGKNTSTSPVKPGPANSAAMSDEPSKPVAAKKAPKGATFLCNDGEYSFSKNDSGACSSHKGVSKKL